MSESTPSANDVFLNVRKAYRLLHDYQQMVIDAIRYVSAQFDIEPNGGCARFGGDAKQGYRYLSTPSWDWLPMMGWEFHFVKETVKNEWLSLSFYIASDTGFYRAAKDTWKEDVSNFAAAEASETRVAVMLRRAHFESFSFMDDKSAMSQFLQDGTLPPDLNDRGFVGKAYDMSCFLSQAEADRVVEDILALAKEKDMHLKRVLKPN